MEMTDFTNHIGKNVEVMTKKGMAVGELVFYGEHASKKKKSKGDLSKMRVGVHLQPEYHKRYGATNGVVSRHTYFGPLKKKHGILTVAGNVRLCDIQPGDGFGEEDGGADAELTEEAQAAVEEQKEEKKRKKAAKEAKRQAKAEAEAEEKEIKEANGGIKSIRRGSFKRFVAAAEESAIYAEEKAKLVAEMRIESVKAEVAQIASRPKNEADLLNSSVSVAKEEAAKQARLEELLTVKSPAKAEVDEFLQPKFVPPSALDRAQDVGKLDVNTIESDIKGGEDEVDLGPIETPKANPEIAENYAAALETPFAEREAAIDIAKQARIKELEEQEASKTLRRDVETEKVLGSAFQRQLMLNAEQAQQDKEAEKEAAEQAEIEARKEIVKLEREEKKAADAIKKIAKDKEKAEKEAARKAEEEARIREAQEAKQAEEDKQMQELEDKIGLSKKSLRKAEAGTHTLRLARKNSQNAHPMLSLAKMGF